MTAQKNQLGGHRVFQQTEPTHAKLTNEITLHKLKPNNGELLQMGAELEKACRKVQEMQERYHVKQEKLLAQPEHILQ